MINQLGHLGIRVAADVILNWNCIPAQEVAADIDGMLNSLNCSPSIKMQPSPVSCTEHSSG